MDYQHDDVVTKLGRLLDALTRQAEGHATKELGQKLDRLTQLVERGNRAEMERLDAATNEIGSALESIAAQLQAPDQAERLRALATKLGAMGKPSADTPIPV